MTDRLKIGQEVLIHGYVDEIRKDIVIIKNEGGYFGTVPNEIKALEQEPCSDAISRQAVNTLIDELARAISDERCCISRGRSTATIMRDILHLPPVNPTKTDWIPVSKRMPEEHEWMGTKKFGTTISDEVYVMLENSEGRRYTQHLSFQNGKLSTADQSRLDAIFKGGTPIAWMPLPKRYEPQESEE